MPPRKTKKAKIDDDDETVDDADTEYKPAARVPAARRGGRRRRGKLEELPNMPLDVIFEVSITTRALAFLM